MRRGTGWETINDPMRDGLPIPSELPRRSRCQGPVVHVVDMNCVICQTPLDPVLFPAITHPNCIRFAEPGEENPFAKHLKDTLSQIILAHEQRNARNHQVKIGPSEVGDPCDRRIGYRLAGVTPSNDGDPWPSIMGTAVHTWLQEAVEAWMKETETAEWRTEATLHIDEFVEGHSDLYWSTLQTVIDWKTMGPNVLKKTRENGPAPGYVIQAHVYGYGYEQAGYPVRKVALACLSRAGWLKDMYIWNADYDRSIAEAALARLYAIARQVVDLDILKESHGHRWEQVPAYPSNDCGWCPFYDPGREPERGADETGCPGR